jgi:hypothetical protein
MLKKIVANKLRDFLLSERETAATGFLKYVDEVYHILPGGLDIHQLYKDFTTLKYQKSDPLKPVING